MLGWVCVGGNKTQRLYNEGWWSGGWWGGGGAKGIPTFLELVEVVSFLLIELYIEYLLEFCFSLVRLFLFYQNLLLKCKISSTKM